MPLNVKEALDAAAAEAASADGGGGGSNVDALRFPLALGPARVEAGGPPPASATLPR